MVDFKNEQLYRQDSIDKQLKITFDSGTITNTEIPSEQFELTESLTSESQLVFGSCEASEIKFRIYNVFLPLKDKWLTVTQTLNGDTENPLQIGKYKVYSDKPTADRGYRDVVAYDAMYDIINTDVASWYNGLTFPMSLKAFRDSFFAFFGIEQENVSLVNDSMEIERTIDVQVLSGKDVIQSICEINGCFGHIARNGKFKYVFLQAIKGGLYPSNDIYPANDLYPQQPNVQVVGSGLYVDTPTYEDFTVKPIDKLQIREKEGDIGVIVGNGDNTYIVEDNFLVYGKSTEELTVIAENTLSVIEGLEYRPFDATLVGNPCIEVGDNVRLHTKYQIIDSYVLQRTLSGVQALRDEFSAEGEEYQSEKVNDIQTEIKQLKGKSNTLERTIEETRSTIANMEEGLQTEITQTADSIRLEVADNTGKISTIEQNVDGITQRVEDVNQELSAEIETNANQIVLGVNAQGKMVLVELSADRSTGTVFTVNADNINLSAEDVISLMANGTINLTGKKIEIASDNFTVDSDGNMSCNNASVTGDVNATTLNAYNKLRLFIGTTFDKDYRDAIWVQSNEDEDPNDVEWLVYSNIRRMMLPVVFKQGITVNGSSSLGEVSASKIESLDYIYTQNYLRSYYASNAVTTASTNCYIDSAGTISKTSTTSSKRFKDDVTTELCEKLNPRSLYDVDIVQFKYKKDYFKNKEDIRYRKDLIGFIAEDIYEKYPICADYHMEDESVVVDGWNQQYMIPAMLKLIQEQHKQLETQQQEIEELKKSVSFLMSKLGDDVNG